MGLSSIESGFSCCSIHLGQAHLANALDDVAGTRTVGKAGFNACRIAFVRTEFP